MFTERYGLGPYITHTFRLEKLEWEIRQFCVCCLTTSGASDCTASNYWVVLNNWSSDPSGRAV